MTLAITQLRQRETGALESALPTNPFERVDETVEAQAIAESTHVFSKGVRCATERRGEPSPRGRSPLEIVLDASEGFIPLWERGCTLKWRFRESSLRTFRDAVAAKAAIERLLGEAILAWGAAAPIKFTQSDSAWDFEIAVAAKDDCDLAGCVLARAFFPDAGRHDLALYPLLFEQDEKDQVETLVHEIGHIFGLRHFFALVKETAWPAEVFGEHNPFSIMNYGEASRLTEADTNDLARLYRMAWSGELKQVNGTPIRFFRPYHMSGSKAETILALDCAPA